MRSVLGSESSSQHVWSAALDEAVDHLFLPCLVEIDGELVAVDLGDAAERLRDGIYVLRIDDALVVKRVALNPVGRRVTIQSDNPAYPDWPDCSLDQIKCIGRVIWSGRRIV